MRSSRLLALTALLPVALLIIVYAHGASVESIESGVANESVTESAQMLDPLTRIVSVNGKAISPSDFKRDIVYLAGANLIRLKIEEFITADWKARLVREGVGKEEDYTVSQIEVEGELKKILREFETRYPDLDYWQLIRARTSLTRGQYIHHRRTTIAFKKVFTPGPPDQWPPITREAIQAGASGTDGDKFWTELVKHGRDKNGVPRRRSPVWIEKIGEMISGQLKKWSDVRYPADGLPPHVALQVGGLQWLADDAFEEVRAGLFTQDAALAVRELIAREALRQELVARGSYVDQDKFAQAFGAFRDKYDSTLFNTETIATAFKGYPTLEAFRSRWRLIRSYENMIADEIDTAVLERHAVQHELFFADGTINLDVIPFLGKNSKSGAWMPNGMAKALQRANRVHAQIERGELTFSRALAIHGEYYPLDQERGQLVDQSYAALRRKLRENEYADLHQPVSVAYAMFYRVKIGELVGPLRGPDAWYLARVKTRRPANHEVSIADAATRELIKDDLLTRRFLEWARQVVARADIN